MPPAALYLQLTLQKQAVKEASDVELVESRHSGKNRSPDKL